MFLCIQFFLFKLWPFAVGFFFISTEKTFLSPEYNPREARNFKSLYHSPIQLLKECLIVNFSCLLDKSNEDASKKSPYFCKTCDRSLSSNNAYSKHLSSELHFKRSSAAVLDEVDSTTRKRTKKLSAAEVIEKVMTDELAEMKMPRKTVFASVNMIICPTCSSRVNRDQFGKHLISHYHHHKSMGHPDNKNLALNYIEEIVMEAPFSCKICNFYCNWNSDFIDHWSGNLHKSCDAAAKEDEADAFAVYWCSFCR